MELYLQFGNGMMAHCEHLLEKWGGGTVVLSPRDLNSDQLSKFALKVKSKGGSTLFDPQFYLPNANHERLCAHSYWPTDYDTGTFWTGSGLSELVAKVLLMNQSLRCSAVILPGILAPSISADWLHLQGAVIQTAKRVAGLPIVSTGAVLPRYLTIALSEDAGRDSAGIETLLEAAENWDVDGFYLVCEHPRGEYLVGDPSWLSNVLDLVAGLRQLRKVVVLGYASHQMLIASCAGVNAICSGTWMNVRSFPPEKFNQAYDDEIKQRSTWFYCPHALSEYKLAFLDIARNQGVLNLMRPEPSFDQSYTGPLFSGSQPTTVGFSEQSAFRHYLDSLRLQCHQVTGQGYDACVQANQAVLTNAQNTLEALARVGVRGQKRDFGDVVEVNDAALKVLTSQRGPILRRAWIG